MLRTRREEWINKQSFADGQRTTHEECTMHHTLSLLSAKLWEPYHVSSFQGGRSSPDALRGDLPEWASHSRCRPAPGPSPLHSNLPIPAWPGASGGGGATDGGGGGGGHGSALAGDREAGRRARGRAQSGRWASGRRSPTHWTGSSAARWGWGKDGGRRRGDPWRPCRRWVLWEGAALPGNRSDACACGSGGGRTSGGLNRGIPACEWRDATARWRLGAVTRRRPQAAHRPTPPG